MSENPDFNPSNISLVSSKHAWYYRVVPKNNVNGTLELFVDNLRAKENEREEMELIFNKRIEFVQIEPTALDQYLQRYYATDQHDSRLQNTYYHGEADHFLNHLITEAKMMGSSDIHIEMYEESCRVRIRIDGQLIQRYHLDKKQYPSLINKIKIVSNLDIAEKRLPQDGRLFFENGHSKFDIRVSVLPTLHGEKIVLRLLNNDAANIDIANLGFAKSDYENYMEGIRKPNGILLISGPTGSGKTTTLYATLKILNKNSRNILTIEDPIEYTLPGINQVQLKESIGLSFPTALRTFLRQDPDIIMLGEIRDPETANMAIRAALTGHLVLSTIHTNSAWGTISRLIDMGIPAFLLASTLNTTVAQRLVRLLCPFCKSESNLDPTLFPRKFKPYRNLHSHFVSKGCSKCFNTGYKGRKAVYEVITIDEDLSEQIKNRNLNIEHLFKEKQIKSLSENSFELFETGQTSLDEIYSLLVS
ncbi:MAG TPA: GspE/PulE family protein [Chitinophagaceae bacterium]|jgi:general secretion pathway protein E/type IV pilus assembly protein PilB